MELTEQPTATAPYEACEQCGSPVDHVQRYCVVCGTRRRHVHDPAARYLSAKASRPRSQAPQPAKLRRRRAPGLGVALALAVIPLAVGLGVLVGRASTSGDDKLIAALRAQKPEVIAAAVAAPTAAAPAGTTPTPAASTHTVASLTSSFPLQSGYAVELQTLPGNTTQAAIAKSERDAASKGAAQTGLILQRDFRVTPAPPSGDDVIFSGAYRDKASADQALSKLSKRFPGATVIQVQAAGTSAAPTGKVLATTQYGSAHQVTGFKVTRAQLNAGAQAVKQIQNQSGKGYVNSQRGLPDQISVP